MKPPSKYKLTISIAPDDGEDSALDGLEFKATYEGISRADIIKPTYANGGIAAMVKVFEEEVIVLTKPADGPR